MRWWYKFRLMFLNAKYRDCIDLKMKNKLWKKIKHHESKLN